MLFEILAVLGFLVVFGLIGWAAYQSFGKQAKAKTLAVVADVKDAKAKVEKAVEDVKKDL